MKSSEGIHTILLGRKTCLEKSGLDNFYVSYIKASKQFDLNKVDLPQESDEHWKSRLKTSKEVTFILKKHEQMLLGDIFKQCKDKGIPELCFSRMILWIPSKDPRVPLIYTSYPVNTKELQQKLVGEPLEPKLDRIINELRLLTNQESRRHVHNTLLVNTTSADRSFLENVFKDTSVYILPETVTKRLIRKLG